MKRAILIATGTVGGLGAVLAVTPPQFTSSDNSMMALPGTTTVAATTPSAKATTKAAPNKSSAPNKSASNNATAAATPTPIKTTAAPVIDVATAIFSSFATGATFSPPAAVLFVADAGVTDKRPALSAETATSAMRL